MAIGRWMTGSALFPLPECAWRNRYEHPLSSLIVVLPDVLAFPALIAATRPFGPVVELLPAHGTLIV